MPEKDSMDDIMDAEEYLGVVEGIEMHRSTPGSMSS